MSIGGSPASVGEARSVDRCCLAGVAMIVILPADHVARPAKSGKSGGDDVALPATGRLVGRPILDEPHQEISRVAFALFLRRRHRMLPRLAPEHGIAADGELADHPFRPDRIVDPGLGPAVIDAGLDGADGNFTPFGVEQRQLAARLRQPAGEIATLRLARPRASVMILVGLVQD